MKQNVIGGLLIFASFQRRKYQLYMNLLHRWRALSSALCPNNFHRMAQRWPIGQISEDHLPTSAYPVPIVAVLRTESVRLEWSTASTAVS